MDTFASIMITSIAVSTLFIPLIYALRKKEIKGTLLDEYITEIRNLIYGDYLIAREIIKFVFNLIWKTPVLIFNLVIFLPKAILKGLAMFVAEVFQDFADRFRGFKRNIDNNLYGVTKLLFVATAVVTLILLVLPI